MKLSRSFTINLSGTDVQINAEISFTAYQIMRARCPAGLPFDITLDHLEIFESYVEGRISTTTLKALDLDTFKPTTFQVHAYGNDVLAIVHESGHVVQRNSATWSEVVESWFIDRQFNEAIESETPHLAHVAGYTRPQPFPSQSGIGYRRAA